MINTDLSTNLRTLRSGDGEGNLLLLVGIRVKKNQC
jgi:hypothetical protein